LPLLPPYSRRLSDAQLRLGLALEFHPDDNERKLALLHIEEAANSLKARLHELECTEKPDYKPQHDVYFDKDNLSLFDSDQLKRERKEVDELLSDLQVKVC